MSGLLFSNSSSTLPATSGEVKNWRHLYGSASSLAVAELAQYRPVVYVCSEASHLHYVEKELSFFCSSTIKPLTFPDWECLPYDRVSPHVDIVSQRLLTLAQLPNWQNGILVVPISTLMQRLTPPNYVHGSTFVLSVGDELDVDFFRQRLLDAGYCNVTQVMSAGEFAVRGGLIDVYPSGADQPFRLDLFDTHIESIRLFETETQRSTDSLHEIRLLPAREFPLNSSAIQTFRQAFRANIDGETKKAQIYREISKGFAPNGVEFYLPLFFEKLASLFDYVPEATTFVFEEGAFDFATQLEAETKERFTNALLNPEWPPLPPEQLFLSVEEIYQQLKQYPRIQLLNLNLKNAKHLVDFSTSAIKQFNINPRADQPYNELIQHLKSQQTRKLIAAESAGRRESLLGVLHSNNITCAQVESWQQFVDSNHQIALTVAELDRGLHLNTTNLELVTESQLYGERTFQKRRRSDKNRDPDTIIRSLAELNIGDPVVHEAHGVGRYRGLETLNIDGDDNEFAVIEYYGGDKIYVPVLSLDIVSRYVGGSPEGAPLHKMGSETWIKLRKKAKEKAYDIAAELLEIQALRLARQGYAFPAADADYDAFSAGFAFEETADQQQVIDDVINDMTAERPMDRLVCGDVGFGKTEIALRAAYMAIAGNKQVVILVPTTLLAQQHFANFSDRFADFPVRVELFSRFRTTKEIQTGLQGITNGTIDIAIGTHKLLQKNIHFNNLGLMIIDEEHRFGVRQKEQLKKLRSEVDILTLTATPIPRTLNFALSGLRDISVIATPPQARLSIKTFVREWDDGLLREAITREIRRGGQIYFLHNEVQTIEKMQARLQDLVPDAIIRIGHGQMNKRELENVMRDFYHQRFNLLLCTTIIESGIDIPTANTMIINRADRFGLAQLHQLRGRVGRSHHQAYAYMLSPDLSSMSGDAQKRLTAIESLDTLGAGFALASQDLEIRGAGELLGESQSGMIDQVGYSMYSAFLDQAINSIQRERQKKRGETPLPTSHSEHININLNIPARFPDEYLPDVHLRLVMYKRIANATSNEQLHELEIETIDRFGLLPDAAKNLFSIASLKLRARTLDIKAIEAGPKGGYLEFLPNPNINIDELMRTVAGNPKEYRFTNSQKIQISREMPQPKQRLVLVTQLLDIATP